MQLHEFLDQFRDAIAGAVVASYPPLYDRAERERDSFALRRLGRRPLGGQADAIRAAALSLQRQPSTIFVGEMGTGKSFCAAAAAYLAGCRSILVVCPPHLVRKWEREVRLAVPGAQVAIARRIEDLERIRRYRHALTAIAPVALSATPPSFTILSREQAKLGYRWRPAVIERLAVPRVGAALARDERGRPLKVLCCPRCGAPLVDVDGIPLTRADLERKKLRCTNSLAGPHPRRPEQIDPRKSGPRDRCNSPLWAADRTGPRRYPLGDYIRSRMHGHFDLVIGDEAHEYKARGSAQGIAFAAMVGAAGRSLILTGTLLGGYASTIFSLLYRVDPAIRAEFGFGDEQRWVQRYGIVERITTKEGGEDDHGEDGRNSKRRSYRTRTIERPGISPAILLNLIGGTVFLRLADVATNLPGYEERVVLFDLDDTDIPIPDIAGAETDSGHADERAATSQARAYRALARELRAAVLDALQSGSKRLLGAYLQSLLAYPDGCTREEIVVDRGDGATGPRVIASAPALPTDRLYPKEQALVELALRERGRGRRLLVYVSHTETRDLTPRLHTILEDAGLRAAVLKSHTVPADRREEWVAARVKEGIDALIVNPRIVQTGLDLLDFAGIAWYELDYSVYVMRQASRRSWRIGQRADVAVYFFAYRGTLQAEALQLVKQKVRASLLVEGELPDEGLAAADGEEDALLALARRLVEPGDGAADDRSLEALFAQARQVEAEAGDALVDHADDPTFVEAIEAHFDEVNAPPGVATMTAAVTSASPHNLAQARLDHLTSDRTAATPPPPPPSDAPPLAGGRVISFEDLARELAPRRKGRARRAAPGQLDLFGS